MAPRLAGKGSGGVARRLRRGRRLPLDAVPRPPPRARGGARLRALRFADQEGFTGCWFGEPVVAGDRATVEYWAILLESGREVTIAGVSLLRFGPDGRVEAQRDYWMVEPGGREPPPGWGA